MRQIVIVPPPTNEIPQTKILYLMALGYHYYTLTLEGLGKVPEAMFCRDQATQMRKLYFRANPAAARQMQEIEQEEQRRKELENHEE